MDADLKARWIAALKGPYADKKGQCYLSNQGQMCCLGVLADMHRHLSKKEDANGLKYLLRSGKNTNCFEDRRDQKRYSWKKRSLYGLSPEHQNELIKINDDVDTFEPIIKYIEENL